MTNTDKKNSIRLFLGTDIDLQNIINDKDQEYLRKNLDYPMRWVNPDNIHMTWKFIGDFDQSKIPDLINKINTSTIQASGIQIEFNKIAAWPNASFPRQLVVLGSDISSNAAKFCKALNTELADLGINKEKRSFNPHITIARFKIKEKLCEPLIIPDGVNIQKYCADINRITLYQSILTKDGSIYKPVQVFNI